MSQLRRQYVSDNRIEAAGVLLDGVLEDLLGHCKSSGWQQLVMGHHAWREIAFGTPRLVYGLKVAATPMAAVYKIRP